MLKRLLVVIAAVLFIIPLANADSFVSVVLQPATFVDVLTPKTETISGSFLWDTTTGVLSDITIIESGDFGNGTFLNPPGGGGDGIPPTDYIGFLTFALPNGDNFGFNYGDHGIAFFSTPGTHQADLIYTPCCGRDPSGDLFNVGTGIVTSLGDGDHDGDDPASVPEPGAMSLLLSSVGVAIVVSKLRN